MALPLFIHSKHCRTWEMRTPKTVLRQTHDSDIAFLFGRSSWSALVRLVYSRSVGRRVVPSLSLNKRYLQLHDRLRRSERRSLRRFPASSLSRISVRSSANALCSTLCKDAVASWVLASCLRDALLLIWLQLLLIINLPI